MARSRIALLLISVAAGVFFFVIGEGADRPSEELERDAHEAMSVPTPPRADLERIPFGESPTELATPRMSGGSVEVRADEGTAKSANTALCAIDGLVADSDGFPVEGVCVRFDKSGTHGEARSDKNGVFTFDELEPGRYRLFVMPRSLPEGLLPPMNQHLAQLYTGEATGLAGTSVLVTSGARVAVELRVFRAATVHGSVRAQDGSSCAQVLVFIHTSGQRSKSASTDEFGHFTITGVYPDAYVAQAQPRPEGALGAQDAPLPLHFTVRAGEALALEPMVFGVGGHTLQGRVVDGDGVAVSELDVLVSAEGANGVKAQWSTNTDAAGRFSVGRVPSQSVQLLFSDGHKPKVGIIQQLVRSETIDIDMQGSEPTRDVGDLVVEMESLYRIEGIVVIDADWEQKQHIGPYAISVRELGGGAPSKSPRRRVDRSKREAIDAREFEWSRDTKNLPSSITLEIVMRCASGAEYTRELVLQPHEPLTSPTSPIAVNFPR